MISVPSEVRLETPFELRLAVANTSPADMTLLLLAPFGEGGVVVDGPCRRSLGTLKPHAATPVTLRLVALEPGVQKLVGMQLLDALTEQVHDLGHLADVFVHNEPSTHPEAPVRLD